MLSTVGSIFGRKRGAPVHSAPARRHHGDQFAAGRALADKFYRMRDLSGRNVDDFMKALGFPSVRGFPLRDGSRTWRWEAPGYYVAITFNADATFREVSSTFRKF